MFHVDTEGSRRAVRAQYMTDRLVTDYFVQQLALRMGHIVLFHVDALYAQDVFTIRRLQRMAKQLNRDLKHFIVVHNMWRYTTVEEVHKHTRTDIVKAFGAEERSEDNCSYWISDQRTIIHVVIAREGSKAGDAANACAFNTLRILIKAAKYSPGADFHFLNNVKHLVEEMLPAFFYHPHSKKGAVPYMINPIGRKVYPPVAAEGNYIYQVAVHAMKWIRRTSVGEVDEQSCQAFDQLTPEIFSVSIEERLNHTSNKTAYFMGLTNKNVKNLTYFPVDSSETGIPYVAFNPRYDVFESNDKWVVMVDVLDSQYFIDFQPDRIAVYGCRSLKNEYQFGGYTREYSADSRRFSTFHIEIKAPEGVNCEQWGRVQKDARNNNGVLLLSFDKKASIGRSTPSDELPDGEEISPTEL